MVVRSLTRSTLREVGGFGIYVESLLLVLGCNFGCPTRVWKRNAYFGALWEGVGIFYGLALPRSKFGKWRKPALGRTSGGVSKTTTAPTRLMTPEGVGG